MIILAIEAIVIVLVCALCLIGGMPVNELWEAVKESGMIALGLLVLINIGRFLL